MTQRARARSWFALVVAGGLAASVLTVIPGLAAAADEARTFAPVGSPQSEPRCAGDWAPDCAGTELTYAEQKSNNQRTGYILVGLGGVFLLFGVGSIVGAVVRRGRATASN